MRPFMKGSSNQPYLIFQIDYQLSGPWFFLYAITDSVVMFLSACQRLIFATFKFTQELTRNQEIWANSKFFGL